MAAFQLDSNRMCKDFQYKTEDLTNHVHKYAVLINLQDQDSIIQITWRPFQFFLWSLWININNTNVCNLYGMKLMFNITFI